MTSSVTGDSLTTQKEISDEQKKFLTEVLTYYQEFAGEKADDEPSRARTAAAAFRVGPIEYRLGRTAEAAAAFRLAIDGYAKLAAEFPAVPDVPADTWPSATTTWGFMLTRPGEAAGGGGAVSESPGDPGEAGRRVPRRAGLPQRTWPAATSTWGVCCRPGEAAGGGGAVSESPGDPGEAGRRVPRRAGVPQGPGRQPQQPGASAGDLGKRPEAEEQYRKALAIQEKLVAEFPAVPEYRKRPGRQPQQPGDSAGRPGEAAGGGGAVSESPGDPEKLVAEFPAVPEYREDLARSHNNLGNLLAGLGKRPEAEEQYRKALAIQEKLVAEFPAVPQYRVDLGGSYCNFGILVSDSGQPGESLEWFEKAIRTLTAVYEQDRRLVQAREFLRNSHVEPSHGLRSPAEVHRGDQGLGQGHRAQSDGRATTGFARHGPHRGSKPVRWPRPWRRSPS